MTKTTANIKTITGSKPINGYKLEIYDRKFIVHRDVSNDKFIVVSDILTGLGCYWGLSKTFKAVIEEFKQNKKFVKKLLKRLEEERGTEQLKLF